MKTAEQIARRNQRQKEYRLPIKNKELKEKESWDDLFNISNNFYSKVRDDQIKQHIGAILNMKPLMLTTKPIKIDKRTQSIIEASDQLDNAYQSL